MIYWNKEHQCDDKTRDKTDNIITLYWPKLMKIKKDLMKLTEIQPALSDCTPLVEVDRQGLLFDESWYIEARLCSGEEEKDWSPELKDAVKKMQDMFEKAKRDSLDQIFNEVMEVVLSLHRVREMQNRMPEFMSDIGKIEISVESKEP